MTGEPSLTLTEAAERLGVHYMTVYRYVRTGRLEGHQRGAQWEVAESEVRRLEEASERPPVTGRRSATRRWPVERFTSRLLQGDENGAWVIASEVLAGGATPQALYLELFAPALRLIGQRWAEGQITVADEHQATVVISRLIGRVGPLLRSRGPRTATVIVGAPAGETHSLPTALAADILRHEGLTVVDLGADVPDDAFVSCATGTDRLTAVAICVTVAQHRRSAGSLIRALRRAAVSVPILVGGAGVSELDARALGADGWTPDVAAIVRATHEAASRPSS